MRVFFLRVVVFSLIVTCVFIALFKWFYKYKSPPKHFNLVLISVDTLRADHMGIYGYPKNTTPHIDTWAKNATVFTQMRTQVPTTYPSFSIFMTGKSVLETNIYDNSTTDTGFSPGMVPIGNNVTTLAQFLQKNNYTTAAFLGTAALEGHITNIGKGFDIYKNYAGFTIPQDAKANYKSLVNVKAAFNWLDQYKNDTFFLWIHIMEPHSPYLPIDEFKCKFNSSYCSEIQVQSLLKWEDERKTLQQCKPEGIPQEKLSLFETLYDGSIASMDKLAGRIFDKLKEDSLDKNTIVIFYGDHGEGFDHNYYFNHAHELYDSHVHIPFIVHVPGTSPKRIGTSLQNTQILPSVLDLLNISYDKHAIHGNSFISLMENENRLYNAQEYRYYVNSDQSKYAIEDGKYKYIYSLKDKACLLNDLDQELYDLKKDPQELTNLTTQLPDKVNSLKKRLLEYILAHRMHVSSTAPLPVSEGQKKVIEELKKLGY